MRKIALLLFVSIPLFTQAQKKSTQSKKLRLGVNFAPEYSYRSLSVNKKDAPIEFIVPIRNDNEKAIIGFSLGANASYQLNNLLNIEFGINYSAKGYKINAQALTFEDQLGTSGFGQITGSSKFHYIEIPIKLGFTFGEKKTQFIAAVGITTGFLLSNKNNLSIKYPDGNIENFTNNGGITYRKLNINPTIAVGLNHNINSKSNIKIEPTFKYGIIAIADAPIKERLWSIGINIGYYISL
jgi:Outer membrane protein beta-barrel domain